MDKKHEQPATRDPNEELKKGEDFKHGAAERHQPRPKQSSGSQPEPSREEGMDGDVVGR